MQECFVSYGFYSGPVKGVTSTISISMWTSFHCHQKAKTSGLLLGPHPSSSHVHPPHQTTRTTPINNIPLEHETQHTQLLSSTKTRPAWASENATKSNLMPRGSEGQKNDRGRARTCDPLRDKYPCKADALTTGPRSRLGDVWWMETQKHLGCGRTPLAGLIGSCRQVPCSRLKTLQTQIAGTSKVNHKRYHETPAHCQQYTPQQRGQRGAGEVRLTAQWSTDHAKIEG